MINTNLLQQRNSIRLNNQYDYYKQRLLEIHLLQQYLQIEYVLIVPLGIIRIVGNVHCYEYTLAQKIIETLHHHNYPNIQYRLEYNKTKPYHTIYYSHNPLILSDWDNTNSKIKGTMFGYKYNIIF